MRDVPDERRPAWRLPCGIVATRKTHHLDDGLVRERLVDGIAQRKRVLKKLLRIRLREHALRVVEGRGRRLLATDWRSMAPA